MDKELTFSEMLNREIEAKRAFGAWWKTNLSGEGRFIRPTELLSKLGKDPEHSGEESWNIASELKKLGVKRGLTGDRWETLSIAENVPLGVASQEEKSRIPFYIDHIDEILELLLKWCSNLSFADRNKEEEEFYTRCMEAGERLLKAKRELEEALHGH